MSTPKGMGSALRVSTIIARNYWAHARVLARSLRAHQPDARLSVLVIDADSETAAAAGHEPFDVLRPADIGVDSRELHRMAGIYDVLELATALKAPLLRHLLDGCEAVVYLDPDIEVFGPIEEAAELAIEHGIVLTPHTTAPLPRDDYGPSELTILESGAYNLGFIAVGTQADAFLDWWTNRLRRDALIDKEKAMFVDQRWVDLAPGYFHIHALRGPGWNVAYWNLPVRELSRAGGGYEVDGEPLRFFHFSGFDAGRPEVLSCYQGERPRIRLEDHPVLAELCARYGEKLMRAGHRAYSGIPYGFAQTASGLPLDRYARRLYRRELVEAESAGRREPPNPFDRKSAPRFEEWLRDPVTTGAIPRYLMALYDERADLRATFPDLGGSDARLLTEWGRERARSEPGVAPALVSRVTARRRDAPSIDGVNVAGYFEAESGVGEGARLLVAALDAAAIPVSVVPYAETQSRQRSPAPTDRYGSFVHDVSIACVNADRTAAFMADVGCGIPEGGYRIAMWAWEVEVLPEWMGRSADAFDEIWVGSEHAARAVRERTTKPVYVFPLPAVRPPVRGLSRAQLGLPEGFLFLYCFDFDSVFERKNPLAVVEAFSRAFAPGTGPQLVIKSVRGDAHPELWEKLRSAADRHPDVYLVDGYVERHEQWELMAACGAYVSLHRAEGFGLTMAEAMTLGKPVVATGYSGNLEFMDETNSWLIPYRLVPIPEGCDPYPTDARWAEPDIDAAAQSMRQIVEDPAGARERGERAAADMGRLHAPSARAAFLRDRLARALAARQTGQPETEPWGPAASASYHLESGPDIYSPARYGFFSRAARRVFARLGRHFMQHQERVQTALLQSVAELEARLRAESRAAREVEADVRELGKLLEVERRRRADLERRLESRDGVEGLGDRALRMRSYAGLFGSSAPVLAIGYEAAEMLELLSRQGIETFSLETAVCTDANGRRLDISDVLAFLEGRPNRSLGGIFTARVIEHLSVGDLRRFLELSRRKLGAGGVLVAETEESGVVRLGAGVPSPITPQTLVELCRSTGFEQAYVLFPDGPGERDHNGMVPGELAVVASVLLSGRR